MPETDLQMYVRMCTIHDPDCGDCPFHNIGDCDAFVHKHYDEAIEIIRKWAEENPLPKVKTYRDDFFEKYPNSHKYDTGNPMVHWCGLYSNGCCDDSVHLCFNCIHWDEPYEEKENNK